MPHGTAHKQTIRKDLAKACALEEKQLPLWQYSYSELVFTRFLVEFLKKETLHFKQ